MNAYHFDCSPYGQGQLNTVQSQLSFLANKKDATGTSDLADFLSEWKDAQEAARIVDDGAVIDNDAKIFWIPDETRLNPCFIWIDFRDGSTWVVSKIKLPWIKVLADLYVEKEKENFESSLSEADDLILDNS